MRMIIGNYPRAEVDDPAVYFTSILIILSEYPQEILDRLTDPRTGLPRHCKFLPRVSEVAEMCEAELKRRRRYVLQTDALLKEHARRESIRQSANRATFTENVYRGSGSKAGPQTRQLLGTRQRRTSRVH